MIKKIIPLLFLSLSACTSGHITPSALPGAPASIDTLSCAAALTEMKKLNSSINFSLLTLDADFISCQAAAKLQGVSVNFGMNDSIDHSVDQALRTDIATFLSLDDKELKDSMKISMKLAIQNFSGLSLLASSSDTVAVLGTIDSNAKLSRVSIASSRIISTKIVSSLQTPESANSISYLSALSTTLSSVSALPLVEQSAKLALVASASNPQDLAAVFPVAPSEQDVLNPYIDLSLKPSFDFYYNLLEQDRSATLTEINGHAYLKIYLICPELSQLTSVYLQLKDSSGNVISEGSSSLTSPAPIEKISCSASSDVTIYFAIDDSQRYTYKYDETIVVATTHAGLSISEHFFSRRFTLIPLTPPPPTLLPGGTSDALILNNIDFSGNSIAFSGHCIVAGNVNMRLVYGFGENIDQGVVGVDVLEAGYCDAPNDFLKYRNRQGLIENGNLVAKGSCDSNFCYVKVQALFSDDTMPSEIKLYKFPR